MTMKWDPKEFHDTYRDDLLKLIEEKAAGHSRKMPKANAPKSMEEKRAKMIGAFFHVVGKDPAGIAEDLIALDFLKPGTSPASVKPVVEKMFEFHLNLKLKDVNFKELTYDLADVMYDYPFRLPSNFTYIMRALMTLEGIGIITDPEFNFFETAKPYAKEFMLRREGADFRKMFVSKLMGRDDGGKINWDRTWKLAKMAFRTVLNTNSQ